MKKRKQFIAVMLAITLIISAFPITTFAADPLIKTFDVNASDKTEQKYYWYSFHEDESPSRYVDEKLRAESTLNFKVHNVKDLGTQWEVTYSTSGYVGAFSERYSNDFDGNVNVTLNGTYISPSSYGIDDSRYTIYYYDNYPSTKQSTVTVPKARYKTVYRYNEDGDPIGSTTVLEKDYGLKLELNIYVYSRGYDFWGGAGTYSGSTTLDRTFTMNMNKLPQYAGALITPQSNSIDGIVYLSGQPGRDIFNVSGRVWDEEGHTITAKLELTYYDSTKPGNRTMTKQQVISPTPTTQPGSNNFSLSVNINSDLFDGTKAFENGTIYYATLTLNDGHDITTIYSSQRIKIDKNSPTVSITSTKVKGGTNVAVNTNDTGIVYLVPYGTYTTNELDAAANNTTGTKVIVSTAGNLQMTAPLNDGYYRAFAVDRAMNISPISAETLVVDLTAPSIIAATKKGNTITLTFSEPLNTAAPFNDDLFIVPVASAAGNMPALIVGEDSLNMKVLNMDYENDPVYSEQYIFTHDDSYFENPNGKASFSGQVLTSPITTFSNVGLYTLSYSFRDNPRNNDAFDEYRLPSNTMEAQFLVHRRPIADFLAKTAYNSSTGTYTAALTDLSYDLDHQSMPDKGIVRKAWKWKQTSSSTWTDGQPTSLSAGTSYDISLTVQDYEGAWSNTVIRTLDATRPPTALFTIANLNNTITTQEKLKIRDISYADFGTITRWQWIIVNRSNNAVVSNGQFTNSNTGTGAMAGYDINVKTDYPDIGQYRAYLRVKASNGLWSDGGTDAISGYNLSNCYYQDFTVKVALEITSYSITGSWNHWRGQKDITGRTLVPNPRRFLSYEKVTFRVTTEGIPDKVEVRLSPELEAMTYTDPNGKVYHYSSSVGYTVNFPIQLTSSDGGKTWTGTYILPLARNTLDINDVRKRAPYSVTFTAYKGVDTKTAQYNDIELTGSVYDYIYMQPEN